MKLSDKLIALCAIIVSICALMVSVYQTRILSKDKDASVWPYIRIGTTWSNEDFTLSVSNDGIGPALIQSVEYDFQDTTFYWIQDLVSILKEKSSPQTQLAYSNVESIGHAIVAQANTDILIIKNDTLLRNFILENMDNFSIKIKYCSIYGKCWINTDNNIEED